MQATARAPAIFVLAMALVAIALDDHQIAVFQLGAAMHGGWFMSPLLTDARRSPRIRFARPVGS